MKNILKGRFDSFAIAGFGVWIFVMWRIAGMPSPGFAGRIIPAAWILAAVLNGKNHFVKWFVPLALSFITGAWLWMVHPGGWILAAAIPVAGLIAWALSVSTRGRYGVVAAVLPVLLLSLLTAEINGDEVRFAEQATALSGIDCERFSEVHIRAGDLSLTQGHHTPLFPLLIAPGLLAGHLGLRVIPFLVALTALVLLAKLSTPRIAVIAALCYPGFSILGLAMTGWLAVALFTLAILLPEGRKWTAVRIMIALILVAVKMRYAGLAAGIIIVEYDSIQGDGKKKKWIVPAVLLSTGLLVLIIDRYLLNGMLFWTRYGNTGSVELIWMNTFKRPLYTIANFGWSLFDPEAGLLLRAPWVLAAISGLFVLRKNNLPRLKKLLIPSIIYWVFLIIWTGTSWHGLPAPAGRMFVPLIPLFAWGLAAVWNKKETRFLVYISMGISALVIASPVCRYNYADGTDSLLALAGITSGFSMVRGNPAHLLVALLLAVSMLIVLRNSKKYSAFFLVIIFAAIFILGFTPGGYEAEDMLPEVMQGARLYPYISDPVERYFWFNSRERMVEFSEPGQSIVLPGVRAGDTLSLKMSSRGGVLAVGSAHIMVETPLIEMPSAYMSMGKPSRMLPDQPENRLMQYFSIPVNEDDIENGTVRILHLQGFPVYLDRIDVLEGSIL